MSLNFCKFVNDFIKIDLHIFMSLDSLARFVYLSSLRVEQKVLFINFNFENILSCEGTYIQAVNKSLQRNVKLGHDS